MANYVKDPRSKRRHCWDRDEAGRVLLDGRDVGKCPSSMAETDGDRLLNDGIRRGWVKMTSSGWPHSVWNLDDRGHVYRATETLGQQGVFHGFPERPNDYFNGGRVPPEIRRAIEAEAANRNVLVDLSRWMKRWEEPWDPKKP